MQNVLITGGAGYIGSHTAKAIKKAGFTPVVYDNLSHGFKKLGVNNKAELANLMSNKKRADG